MAARPVVLFLARVFKGNEGFAAARALGWDVVLLTTSELLDCAWDRASLRDVVAVPDLRDRRVVRNVVAWLARTLPITRIATVDDPGVELAGHLRELLQLEGMTESDALRFRDKLAMRVRSRAAGIPVPAFARVVNDAELEAFVRDVPAPWLLKPRTGASSEGITRVPDANALREALRGLGDERVQYVLERFVPSDVFHVDAVVHDGRVVFEEAHQYRTPLLDVVQGGLGMVTATVPHASALERALFAMHRRVVTTLGLRHGVTHGEYLRAHGTGELLFLETAARGRRAHSDARRDEHGRRSLAAVRTARARRGGVRRARAAVRPRRALRGALARCVPCAS